MPSSMSVARSFSLPSLASSRIPPRDGRVLRAETARPASWSASKSLSREIESFIERDFPSSYLDQMY